MYTYSYTSHVNEHFDIWIWGSNSHIKIFWGMSKVLSHRGDHFDIWLRVSNLNVLKCLCKNDITT